MEKDFQRADSPMRASFHSSQTKVYFLSTLALAILVLLSCASQVRQLSNPDSHSSDETIDKKYAADRGLFEAHLKVNLAYKLLASLFGFGNALLVLRVESWRYWVPAVNILVVGSANLIFGTNSTIENIFNQVLVNTFFFVLCGTQCMTAAQVRLLSLLQVGNGIIVIIVKIRGTFDANIQLFVGFLVVKTIAAFFIGYLIMRMRINQFFVVKAVEVQAREFKEILKQHSHGQLIARLNPIEKSEDRIDEIATTEGLEGHLAKLRNKYGMELMFTNEAMDKFLQQEPEAPQPSRVMKAKKLKFFHFEKKAEVQDSEIEWELQRQEEVLLSLEEVILLSSDDQISTLYLEVLEQ